VLIRGVGKTENSTLLGTSADCKANKLRKTEKYSGDACLPDFLVGTGGWTYFKVPNKPSLKAYSEAFNFVEINYTFYEYPNVRMVEGWRHTVPKEFTFSVRCHQDLTHKIGLRPIDEAYQVLGQMVTYCRLLNSPFLVLETPVSFVLDKVSISAAKDFFASVCLNGVRLVWEIRAPITEQALGLMRDFNIIHCLDISRNKPSVDWNDMGYARLFGKGKHNIYQFTDEELQEIDKNASETKAKVVALSYHGARMSTDALRFAHYKKTGIFLPITAYVGLDSARTVLSEDSVFPSSKQSLISNQGWKVIDLTIEKRVHLSELLTKMPEKTYNSLNEVVNALEAVL
jgi:uncharacterized protein YecE (DUF72 family)